MGFVKYDFAFEIGEAGLFEEAITKYGKDFSDIQKDFVSFIALLPSVVVGIVLLFVFYVSSLVHRHPRRSFILLNCPYDWSIRFGGKIINVCFFCLFIASLEKYFKHYRVLLHVENNRPICETGVLM